jgi:cell fate regulator YaaT (PSP1 superfamily)
MQPLIVGIRFQKIGKIYHFDSSKFPEIHQGDFVVVDTTRGTQLGQVIQFVEDPPHPPEGNWKAVQRIATPQDLAVRQIWQKREVEAMVNCRAKAAELKLADVKIVSAEFSFDGCHLTFQYSSEASDKLDLKGLRRALSRIYPHTQIEMHQIGPRDVAKILGGMGACGMETRCCALFLTEFSPISIKMAKDQGISLTPTEITGMCGRLRCCLVYEYEQYVEARKQLPKRGKQVTTSLGNGKVIEVYPLKQAVVVELETGIQHEFMRNDIQPLEELEALRQKAEAPCEKHPEGGCDCGKKGKKKAP